MTKLKQEQIDRIRVVLSENYLQKTNLSSKDLSILADCSKPVLQYYKGVWGYSKKQLKKNKKVQKIGTSIGKNPEIDLKKAIDICKQNGLKVTREKITIEEL